MKLKDIKIYSVLFTAFLFCLLGLTACSSQLDKFDEKIDGATGFVRFSICEAGEEARTVFPVDGDVADFKNLTLSYMTNYSDKKEIGTCAKYSDLSAFEAAIPAGTYTFQLTAQRFGTTFTAQKSATVAPDTTVSLVFDNLSVLSGDTGKISVVLKFPSSIATQINSVTSVYVSLSDYEDIEIAAEYDSTENSVTVERENLKKGDGLLMIKGKDSDGNSLLSYIVAIQVKAGYESAESFDYSGDSALENLQFSAIQKNKITYYANFDDECTDNYVQSYYPDCKLLDMEGTGFGLLPAAEGKEFLGWNTKKDGSGEDYAANFEFQPWDANSQGSSVTIKAQYARGEFKLYAQWSD